ncbi:MAG: substrate-binding domain-containing protein [Anaerolineae bacterium]|nr:substrate-binding domain-containing protein [Anaerolineae bacterium]MDQ7035656.1 substrate-binding domain-containing protein [Anaerolineae bacterium]
MRLQFNRTTFIFFLFVIIIAAIFGIQEVVQRQPPLEITITVDPLAEAWARAAAAEYNDSTQLVNGTTRIQVAITVTDDLDVWRGNPNWNSSNHPDAWIASSSLSATYIPTSLPFTPVVTSLARTPLVWGGFGNRVAVLTNNDLQAFDWTAVQTVATNQRWESGGNVNMAINWTTSSMSGVGALMTAIAHQSNSTTITRDLINDAAFETWFTPIHDSVRNAERIGGSPAEAMASRGTTVADFALLPEVQWLQSIDSLVADGFTFSYPTYQFILDFPILSWDDAQTTDKQREAVQSFANFLISNRGQTLAIENGLRPANSDPDSTATLFANAQAYGIQLTPDLTQIVQPDNRNTSEAIIRILE